MQRCLELAEKGSGNVSSNPMVGCVIVHNNKIIGEGYHQNYGEAHAEVNAINAVKNKSLLAEATLYVNLEPCSHHGKTPPCSDLIIANNIPKVVIGAIDTHSKVAGKGIERLKSAGIEVIVPVLEKECFELNKRFYTFHNKLRPYVILKWAETSNGFIAPNNQNKNEPAWITQPETKLLTHKWRAEEDAILVGKNTAIKDNPSLTCREVEGNNPTRILLDSNLEVSKPCAILNNEAPILVFNSVKSGLENNIEYISVDAITSETILKHLHQRNILSVIIEGGSSVLQHFINTNVWDEARVLSNTTHFEQGIKAPNIINHAKLEETFSFGEDNIRIYKPL